ncbi:MAG: hypothetical protein CMF96_00585 [Candidatus Marinimicrobia bacterium]|nr:hypothetical protein [Candidatus Neomarinimicrobiota bacterium]|tara:strand:- start:727 stop:1035 length:309 start_codon:yes stop_codon:yes gene_type:complete
MKYLFYILIGFSCSQSAEVTKVFNINGMMCGHSCPMKVKESTNEIKGVKLCDVSYENSNATITFDDEVVSAKAIAKKITDFTYYKVELNDEKKTFWEKLFGN